MRQLTPHHARRRNFSLHGAVIAALDTGPLGARDVVLFVPGYTGSKEDFAAVLDPIAELGYRAVAMDLPGHHGSSGPADPRSYTTDWLGSVVVELANKLGGGDRVSLVGHSFGGLVARAAVVAEPGRFANVTLMASGPGALVGILADTIALLEPLLPKGKAAIYRKREELARLDPRAATDSPEVQAFLRTRFMNSSLAALEGTARAVMTEPDRVAELAATGVPTLVCFGPDDYGWPPEVQSDMSHRLHAEQVIIAGAQHSPMLEQPAATVAALHDFWRHHGPVELAPREQ